MSAINHFIKKGVRQAEIDEFLSKELSRAGYGGVEITKTPLGERIIIHASKPGVVIGRRGKTIRALTSDLIARYGFDDPKIDVQEVKNPEMNPKVMAYSLVSAIERGVHRRRAAYSALRRIINSGAKGCEIIIAGKLTSKRSRHEAYRMGLVAKSGEIGSEYVKTANAIAVMKLGTIGVTVSIMRGDVNLPDDITVLSVNLDKDEEEMVVDVKDDKEITPEKAEKVKEKPKEKVTEKKPDKPKKAPAAKKTDLDKKVEELSDLIEKTPGEEKKAKPKTPKKKVKKEDAKKVKKPKPAVKKDEKAKTPAKTTKKKTTPKKKKTTTKKKSTTKTKSPSKMKVDVNGDIKVTLSDKTYTVSKSISMKDLKAKRIPKEVKDKVAEIRGWKTWKKLS